MSLADELQKLAQLKSTGALSESEFEQAKKKLLEQSSGQTFGPPQVQQAPDKGSDRDDSLLTALGGFGSEFDFFQRYGCRISKGFYRMGTRNGL